MGQCRAAGDNGTREMLEKMLREEEQHADWLETQQDLIKNVTLPNYLQSHMEPGGD